MTMLYDRVPLLSHDELRSRLQAYSRQLSAATEHLGGASGSGYAQVHDAALAQGAEAAAPPPEPAVEVLPGAVSGVGTLVPATPAIRERLESVREAAIRAARNLEIKRFGTGDYPAVVGPAASKVDVRL